MEWMNWNVISKIRGVVPLPRPAAESLSWNCGHCTSWRVWISWRWLEKSIERRDKMDDRAGFKVMGEMFSNQLEIGAKKEINDFSHCCG